MKKLLMASMLIFVFLTLTGVFSIGASAAQYKPAVGYKVPNATVTDLDGNEVDIYSVISSHKATLVLHWATWCPYCKKVLPQIEKVYKAFSNEDVAIMAISYREAPATVKGYLSRNSWSFPVYTNRSGVAHDLYQVYTIPTTFVVDQDGIIHGKFNSKATLYTLSQVINPLLEDK